MNITRVVCCALAPLLLVACGTAPRLQSLQPQTSVPASYSLALSPQIENTNHVTQHLDTEKGIVYHQNFGGGGAALGLLGPFGVAANIAMIESNTKKDAEQLRGKVSVRPREIFAEVAKSQGLSMSPGTTEPKRSITPYLYVSKTEGEMLLLASALIIEQGTGAEKWTGRYMYQLPQKYTVSELSQLNDSTSAQLREAVATGFSLLLKNISAETPERLEQEQKILLTSDFITPRFSFEMYGSLISNGDEIVWIRTVSGVYGVRKPHITFTVDKS